MTRPSSRSVVIDDGRRERLDERFGDGVVELQAALRPVTD